MGAATVTEGAAQCWSWGGRSYLTEWQLLTSSASLWFALKWPSSSPPLRESPTTLWRKLTCAAFIPDPELVTTAEGRNSDWPGWLLTEHQVGYFLNQSCHRLAVYVIHNWRDLLCFVCTASFLFIVIYYHETVEVNKLISCSYTSPESVSSLKLNFHLCM